MCISCDLLTGLDLDEIAATEPPTWALHLPQDLAGLSLTGPVAPTVARLPTAPARPPGRPGPLPSSAASLAADALAAYERYRVAAAQGFVQREQCWQWVLPSPFSWLSRNLPEAEVAEQLAPLQRLLREALERVTAVVAARDLALQWDLPSEAALWESRGRDLSAGRRLAGKVLEGLAELAAYLPADAHLGFHLCRHDADGRWAPDPGDAMQVSHLAGALLASVDRNVDFLHLPAARDDVDADWYAPLTRLQPWPDTALHVGVAWPGKTVSQVRERLQVLHAMLPRALAAPACSADTVAARIALETALAAS